MDLPRSLRAALAHRKSVGWIVALALLLASPAIFSGFALDDHTQHLMSLDEPPVAGLARDAHDLFAFLPRDHEGAMGALPWFADPDLHASFFRPLTSWTIALDLALWPASAPLGHLHNLLWFAALVLAVGSLYRRLIPQPWIAGLATLLYAIDDCHAVSVGWIANRSALISTLFAVLALLFFVRWRSDAWRPGALLAPVFLALGLLAGEMALCITAFMFAYVLVLDRGSAGSKIASLIPCAVVSVLWMLAYHLLGYGAAGSGLYVDPLADPLDYLAALPLRVPALLLAHLTPVATAGSVLLSPMQEAAFALFATVVLIALVWLCWPWLRSQRAAWFWGVGMLVGLLPVCATFAHERVLMVPGIGGTALVALFLGRIGAGTRDFFARTTTRWLWGLAAFTHLVLAPLLLPPKAVSMGLLGRAYDNAARSLDRAGQLAGRDLVIVNGPDFFASSFTPVVRADLGLEMPARTLTLTTTVDAMTVTRVDERSIRLATEGAFANGPFDRLLWRSPDSFAVGNTYDLGNATLLIEAVNQDGLPAILLATFDTPLEDPARTWAAWTPEGYRRFDVPAVGETVRLPGTTLTDGVRLLVRR
jgi:hypothetical protein